MWINIFNKRYYVFGKTSVLHIINWITRYTIGTPRSPRRHPRAALRQSAVDPYTFFSPYGSFFVYRIIILLLFFLFLFRHYAHTTTTIIIIIIARKLKATEARVAAYGRHTHVLRIARALRETVPLGRRFVRANRFGVRVRAPAYIILYTRVCVQLGRHSPAKRPKSLNQSSKTTIIIFNIVLVCVCVYIM